MAALQRVVLDDRLLIEELLVGLHDAADVDLSTTTYWYDRACRAAVAGGAAHLSGPFASLPRPQQERAILSLLLLRDDIVLPDPRRTVPVMAEVSLRHPRLNLLNLEVVATGLTVESVVWLSAEAATGVLPGVLDAEGIRWRQVALE